MLIIIGPLALILAIWGILAIIRLITGLLTHPIKTLKLVFGFLLGATIGLGILAILIAS